MSGKTKNLLCLHGPSGSGKSRILMTIERGLAKRAGAGKTLRAGTESLIDEITGAFRAGEMSDFRKKWEEVDCLLLDNLWVLASRPVTAREISRLLRQRIEHGRLSIVASDLSLDDWRKMSPEIAELIAASENIRLADTP